MTCFNYLKYSNSESFLIGLEKKKRISQTKIDDFYENKSDRNPEQRFLELQKLFNFTEVFVRGKEYYNSLLWMLTRDHAIYISIDFEGKNLEEIENESLCYTLHHERKKKGYSIFGFEWKDLHNNLKNELLKVIVKEDHQNLHIKRGDIMVTEKFDYKEQAKKVKESCKYGIKIAVDIASGLIDDISQKLDRTKMGGDARIIYAIASKRIDCNCPGCEKFARNLRNNYPEMSEDDGICKSLTIDQIVDLVICPLKLMLELEDKALIKLDKISFEEMVIEILTQKSLKKNLLSSRKNVLKEVKRLAEAQKSKKEEVKKALKSLEKDKLKKSKEKKTKIEVLKTKTEEALESDIEVVEVEGRIEDAVHSPFVVWIAKGPAFEEDNKSGGYKKISEYFIVSMGDTNPKNVDRFIAVERNGTGHKVVFGNRSLIYRALNKNDISVSCYDLYLAPEATKIFNRSKNLKFIGSYLHKCRYLVKSGRDYTFSNLEDKKKSSTSLTKINVNTEIRHQVLNQIDKIQVIPEETSQEIFQVLDKINFENLNQKQRKNFFAHYPKYTTVLEKFKKYKIFNNISTYAKEIIRDKIVTPPEIEQKTENVKQINNSDANKTNIAKVIDSSNDEETKQIEVNQSSKGNSLLLIRTAEFINRQEYIKGIKEDFTNGIISEEQAAQAIENL